MRCGCLITNLVYYTDIYVSLKYDLQFMKRTKYFYRIFREKDKNYTEEYWEDDWPRMGAMNNKPTKVCNQEDWLVNFLPSGDYVNPENIFTL